jgi:integral membrane sensor domain MASE1
MNKSNLSTPTRLLLLAVMFYLAGLAGNAAKFVQQARAAALLPHDTIASLFVHNEATLVWPPAGIALGALLLFGYRYWPGVALGSLLFSVMTGQSRIAMVCTVVGNTVGAVLCAHLLERYARFQNSMERVRDVSAFVVLACVLGATFNAACSAVGACYESPQLWDGFLTLFLKWWIPNAMACLVVTPVILTWGTRSCFEWKWRLGVEAILCGIGLTLATLLSFNTWTVFGLQSYPFAYLPYPFLVWGALRLGQRGATAGTLVVAVLAINASLKQQGPFAAPSETLTFVLLGTYLGILAMTNMLLTAMATEYRMPQAQRRTFEQKPA